MGKSKDCMNKWLSQSVNQSQMGVTKWVKRFLLKGEETKEISG